MNFFRKRTSVNGVGEYELGIHALAGVHVVRDFLVDGVHDTPAIMQIFLQTTVFYLCCYT